MAGSLDLFKNFEISFLLKSEQAPLPKINNGLLEAVSNFLKDSYSEFFKGTSGL